MQPLDGKVALVTGGGSGIGLACAEQLLKAGAKVAIAGRDKAKLDHAARHLPHRDRVRTVAVDVADTAQVGAMVEQVTRELGPIAVLVNNAGTNLKERTFRELTPETWDRLIRTNLDGAFYVIHAVLPGMLRRKDGVIVNVVSVAGKRASPLGGVAYAASKFGMHALGLGLAEEIKASGVRVSNVYPGEVDTPILEFRPTPISDEHRERILRPEDIAGAVLFVATLPPHVSVPELVMKPTSQTYI
jgi:NADP-dependent 3-hydroxy acid dehydrogenase YdfG